MNSNFEKQWNQGQMDGWRDDRQSVVSFFKKYSVDIADTYDQVTGQDYDQTQVVCYLISKIRKSIKICDFLDKLADDGDDVDAIKIFFLISHAEITMNNLGHKGSKRELVNKYFEPVKTEHKLDYKVRFIPEKIPYENKTLSGADVLYKIRNDYAHEGNYTGTIFRSSKSKHYSYNVFSFQDNKKLKTGECNYTYSEFLTIYMEALKNNIILYIKASHK